MGVVRSWYYPETKTLTVYSQDSDTYEFQKKAETDLRQVFAERAPVPVSYKSNDAILCQLVRNGEISIEALREYRKDMRKKCGRSLDFFPRKTRASQRPSFRL